MLYIFLYHFYINGPPTHLEYKDCAFMDKIQPQLVCHCVVDQMSVEKIQQIAFASYFPTQTHCSLKDRLQILQQASNNRLMKISSALQS